MISQWTSRNSLLILEDRMTLLTLVNRDCILPLFPTSKIASYTQFKVHQYETYSIRATQSDEYHQHRTIRCTCREQLMPFSFRQQRQRAREQERED